MRRLFYPTLLISVVIVGCTSFGTAHQNFVESLNITVRNNVTIDKLSGSNYDPIFAVPQQLIKIEKQAYGTIRYHYDRPNLWGRHCYYYLVVDGDSRKVVGWGFDDVEGVDPKKECGISG